jgi:hypothetical protein
MITIIGFVLAGLLWLSIIFSFVNVARIVYDWIRTPKTKPTPEPKDALDTMEARVLRTIRAKYPLFLSEQHLWRPGEPALFLPK